MSLAEAWPAFTKKLAWRALTRASPPERPFSPSSSLMRPAEAPGGVFELPPALFCPSGGLAGKGGRGCGGVKRYQGGGGGVRDGRVAESPREDPHRGRAGSSPRRGTCAERGSRRADSGDRGDFRVS